MTNKLEDYKKTDVYKEMVGLEEKTDSSKETIRSDIKRLMAKMRTMKQQMNLLGSIWNSINTTYRTMSEEEKEILEEEMSGDYGALWSSLIEDNEIGDWFW